MDVGKWQAQRVVWKGLLMTKEAAYLMLLRLGLDLDRAVTHGGVWIGRGQAENLLELFRELDEAAKAVMK